jgi:paraquat-inducible protein B
MNDVKPEGEAPAPQAAEVKVPRRRFPIVWLIPLVAALIGAWLFYKTLSEKGPEITITFETAEGLEAGKTKIKLKDVDVGTVKSIRIDRDLTNVIVVAEMVKDITPHLTENTRFWVVRPRLSASGVSGLGTLVSGAYIEVDPGQGSPARAFVGLEVPPVIRSHVAGREFRLRTDELGSLSAGAPIFYRGVQVGEVLGYQLSDDLQEITLPIFIRAPHDTLIRSGSRFWNASGIDVRVDAEGVQVRTESVQAILTGGVAFDTPVSGMDGEPSPEGTVFPLYDSFASISEAQYTIKTPYLMYFDGSVRGLNAGSPVEFRGIKIGTVTDVRLQLDTESKMVRIPVTVQIEPERIDVTSAKGPLKELAPRERYQAMGALVERGLRAQLQPGNILTGQLLVALDFHPDAPPAELRRGGAYPEIPTVPSNIEQITRSVSGLLDKVAALPLDEMVAEARKTVQGVNALLSAPSVQRAVASLDEVPPLMMNARKAVANAEATLNSTQDLVGRESQVRRDLTELMRELKDTARALRVLADYLDRHPEALIRGKGGDGR